MPNGEVVAIKDNKVIEEDKESDEPIWRYFLVSLKASYLLNTTLNSCQDLL